ncbi:MAG TPA: V-type ATP synthase subunit K [Candidatus Galloscillospira excrementipullorum]|nr:V-type ATP synthase subunit K [Candidatus Galloscillospira excrementipullorum]
MFELNGIFFAMLGAAIASGLAGTGSAKGCGVAGEAAAGVIAEDPSKFGLTLLLQALPGTQGIYGTLMAFLVLNKIGAISGNFVNIDAVTGMLIMFSCIPVGLVGWTSGYAQGKTCAAGICMIAKRPEEIAKGMVYGAMVETYAVLALLISFLAFINIPV